jgi:hypothetical protein
MLSNHNNHPSTKALVNVSVSLLVLALSACGVQQKPHYGDKTFGQTADEVTNTQAPVVHDAPPPVHEVPAVTEPQDPEAPLDAVLSHYGFEGSFNLKNTRRIFRGPDDTGSGTISEGGTLDGLVSTFLGIVIGSHNRESLDMLVKQNGARENVVTQKVITGGGDKLSLMKGDDSQSGAQTIDWALPGTELAATCPSQFICIERMVWVPKSGKTITYCYVDHATKTPVAIPYSANPNFSAESFSTMLATSLTSKAIEVVTHPGVVACDATDIEILDRKLVRYELSIGDQTTFSLTRATDHPLTPDAEIVVDYSLVDGTSLRAYLPKVGPYIDQLTRLNSRVSYFINTAEHVLVKIDRTVQSPFKAEGSQLANYMRDTFGEWAAVAFNYAFPARNDTEGVQLTYSFEFCTHLSVIPNYDSHCTGPITP